MSRFRITASRAGAQSAYQRAKSIASDTSTSASAITFEASFDTELDSWSAAFELRLTPISGLEIRSELWTGSNLDDYLSKVDEP